MKEMWEALEKGDDQEILAVLRKRDEEARSAKNTTARPDNDEASSHHADG
ncbi:MAG: hypothetical protein ACYDC6_14490 [Acidobacteriaceae bacterium]